jgi:hypothetical protein
MEKKEREEIKKEFHLLIKEFCLVSRRAVTEAERMEVLWPHKLQRTSHVGQRGVRRKITVNCSGDFERSNPRAGRSISHDKI